MLFHLIVLLTFLFSYLTYPPAGMDEWPVEPEQEIVMDEIEDLYATGEFVRTGDIKDPVAPVDKPSPSDVKSPEPTQDAPDLENAG